MIYTKDYVDLKSKSKVAIKKIAAVAEVKNSDGEVTTEGKKEYFVIEEKTYSKFTGEANPPSQREIRIKELEIEKSALAGDKERLDKAIATNEAMLTDIKAL